MASLRSSAIILRMGLLASFPFLNVPRLPAQNPAAAPDDVGAQAVKFTALLGAIEQHYMDPVDPDHAIFDGGIRGMLSSLDPFCAFLDRDQFELMKQQARGESIGFGSILYVSVGKVLILQTTQGSPSFRAGLGPGDEIVSVNGERIDRLDFQSLVDLLKRSRSHPVRLGVIQPGKLVPEDFNLRPAEVALPTVDKAFLWSPGIAYLHIDSFEGKTPDEVASALDGMDAAHLKGLFLDLRDNHGGIVDSAAAVASLFLKQGEVVLTTRGRKMPEKVYHVAAMPKHYDLPIVTLVNGDTASAAEVLAAALQEHDRAVIAGLPTYGKGVVQSVQELSEDTGLALTAGQYFTPSGRSIQRPLPGTALTFASLSPSAEPQKNTARTGNDPAGPGNAAFHTDNGRPVTIGGGVTPDVTIPAPMDDPWLAFVSQRGYVTSYAGSYLTTHSRLTEPVEISPEMLDEFKQTLLQSGVRVPDEYWSKDQDILKVRIKVELMSLAFGLDRAEEFATKSDPQAQKAARLFPRGAEILKGH
ncbi:MAG TPA: S41 family peptidase [Terriglobia bacterium]|nr:S41 family peptidase [Terriglobia bacterium]